MSPQPPSAPTPGPAPSKSPAPGPAPRKSPAPKRRTPPTARRVAIVAGSRIPLARSDGPYATAAGRPLSTLCTATSRTARTGC